eukprot:2036031-Rhodomonas_salina.3
MDTTQEGGERKGGGGGRSRTLPMSEDQLGLTAFLLPFVACTAPACSTIGFITCSASICSGTRRVNRVECEGRRNGCVWVRRSEEGSEGGVWG